MKVIILGAGDTGLHLAAHLAQARHSVCIIERQSAVAAETRERVDAQVLEGSGSSVVLLEEAGVSECDLFLGLTRRENANFVACSLAKALGAKRALARVPAALIREQWLFDYKKRFDVDYLFSDEHLAAAELAKFLRNPDALAVEEVAGGRVELLQLEVNHESAAAGKSLRALKLPPRLRVGTVQRENRLFVPAADDPLLSGDVVTVFGNPRHLQEVKPLFLRTGKSTESSRRVVIFGGGDVGLTLARMLENGPFQVRLLEKDKARCEFLTRILNRVAVLNADATSSRILREEQVGEADFFVAASEDDEDNVMTCLMARDLGAGAAFTLLRRADYAEVVVRTGAQLGINGAVSPRQAVFRDLSRFFSDERVRLLAELPGEVQLVQFEVSARSTLAGKKVGEAQWPAGSVLVCLVRGPSAQVPAAEDVLLDGDTVMALVAKESRKSLDRMVS